MLIVALMLERGALDFYTKAQKRVKDEEAAGVFQRLVAMEDMRNINGTIPGMCP